MANVGTFPKEFDIKNERERMMKFILSMLKKADGTTRGIRQLFKRRAQNGCPKAIAYLQLLNEYEQSEDRRIQEILDRMNDAAEAQFIAQKKKFSKLYPPVNI